MTALRFLPVGSQAGLATIAALAREIWEEYYVPLIGRAQVDYMVSRFQTVEAMERQIREEEHEYYLIEREGPGGREARTIGYFAVQPRPAEASLFLSKLYVLAAERRGGTGRACMEFIEQLAQGRGCERLWLTVNKGNASVDAYKRLGFQITADLVMDIGGGFVMDDYRMEKRLR